MKYYLIVGEASGDLHASHLMRSLQKEDPEAQFRFFGGDLMTAVGGTRVKLSLTMAESCFRISAVESTSTLSVSNPVAAPQGTHMTINEMTTSHFLYIVLMILTLSTCQTC